jgi:uncharacterized protein YbaA (DUF1428 family)
MDTYVDGFVIPVAKDKLDEYKRIASRRSDECRQTRGTSAEEWPQRFHGCRHTVVPSGASRQGRAVPMSRPTTKQMANEMGR